MAARSFVMALVVSGLAIACDGTHERPSHLESFRLAGPAEVAPGSSARFEAILDRVATLSDVSEQVEWTSSNPSVLTIDAGLATGRTPGEATVTARLDTRQADPAPVMVLPPGTFRVRGRVVTGPTGNFSVASARVEGPFGMVTTTDTQGRFALYGVPASSVINASKAGYALATTSVQLSNHEQQVSMLMRPALAGTFTLTITPGTCSSGPPLPANLLQRTYSVVFTQSGANGTQAQGSMPGTNMTVVTFFGNLVPAQERWSFSFTIGERLSDGNAVTFNGSAFIRLSDMAGEFQGRIALNHPMAEDALARCEATGFGFALRP